MLNVPFIKVKLLLVLSVRAEPKLQLLLIPLSCISWPNEIPLVVMVALPEPDSISKPVYVRVNPVAGSVTLP